MASVSTPSLWKRAALVGTMAAGLLFVDSAASLESAEADTCAERQEEADKGGGKGWTKINGVIVITKVQVICGKVPKPNVIYVLQATAINYEWENLKQDFLPKIRQSVKKAPF